MTRATVLMGFWVPLLIGLWAIIFVAAVVLCTGAKRTDDEIALDSAAEERHPQVPAAQSVPQPPA